MHFKKIFVFMLILFLIGCATRNIPKKQFAENFKSYDFDNYLDKYFDDMAEDDKWNKCFDIPDAEFKKQIVKIHKWCVNEIFDLNYDKLPDKLTKSESSMIGNSIDQCAKAKYIVMNKEKFIYDKHTKQIDRCLKTYQFIYSME